MIESGRLTEPVSPNTANCAPCQASRPASVTTKDGMPNVGDHEAVEHPDRAAHGEAGQDREPRVEPLFDGQDRHHRRREAADGADRQVDLAEQQHEDDADRDRRDRGDLKREVREVDRGEEPVVGDLEDRPDDRDAQEDADRAELSAREPAQHDAGSDALARSRLRRRERLRPRCSKRSLLGRALSLSPNSAPVIAATISSWLESPISKVPATRPSRSTVTRSATWKTSARLWEMTITPRPRSLRRSINSRMWAVWTTPRAAVGSSRRTIFGSPRSERAIAMAWRWPPESRSTSVRTLRIVVTPSESEQLGRLLLHGSFVEDVPVAVRGLLAEEEVGDDVEVLAKREVLVDGRDPEFRRGLRRVELDTLPPERRLAVVRRLHARDRLDQGRLAGAVVAQEAHDLAGPHLQVDLLHGFDGAEALRHSLQREEGTGGGRFATVVVSLMPLVSSSRVQVPGLLLDTRVLARLGVLARRRCPQRGTPRRR